MRAGAGSGDGDQRDGESLGCGGWWSCRPDLADDDARAADAALLLDLVEGLTAASFQWLAGWVGGPSPLLDGAWGGRNVGWPPCYCFLLLLLGRVVSVLPDDGGATRRSQQGSPSAFLAAAVASAAMTCGGSGRSCQVRS
jgi:hypothetical protein